MISAFLCAVIALKAVFERLSAHGIIVNAKKCVFAQREIEFLGHKVNSGGISLPESRVQALLDYPKPADVKELEKFLGMYAYIHRFIPKASGIVQPLSLL